MIGEIHFMEIYIFYIVLVIIFAIIWGFVCRQIIYNKGYDQNWFWWGFWFGWIAVIVALCKPEVERHAYSYDENDRKRYGSANPSDWSNRSFTLSSSPHMQKNENYVTEIEKLNLLGKYKILLDSGAISQQEYNRKKKELTGLTETMVNMMKEKNQQSKEIAVEGGFWRCENCGEYNSEERKNCKYCGKIRYFKDVY